MKLNRSLALGLATLAFTFAASAASAAEGDRDISRQLTNDLYRSVAIGPYGVRVRTVNGVVRLSGSVGTVRDYWVAQRQAQDASGVSDVQNYLSVLIR